MEHERELMFKYLSRSRVLEDTLRDVVIPHLVGKGFATVGDLQDLEHKYLCDEGITELDRDRIMKLVKSKSTPEAFTSQMTKASTLQTDNIYLRYVLCKDLFSADIAESTLDNIKPNTPLKDIVSAIYKDANLSADEVIELYSSEGYPLHSNEITNTESLIKWGIEDGDLFFVLIRRKDQPGELKFATLPKVDHDTGEETFTIEPPLSQRNFTVNAYVDTDSPEDIAQKIYSITDIPVPYMSLYVRQGYCYERLNTFTELKDNDIIRVILRNPQEVATPRSPHYGLRSYNTLVTQTPKGLSKFYSILKFLCSTQPYNKKYEFDKLLSYLLTQTEFPPLVHSLRTLREQSYLTIPGWTALVEGCYFLFKAILDNFIAVPSGEIFEYSDYMWALLIHLSKGVSEVSNVECDQFSLVCPLSDKRICTPVRIDSCGRAFDKVNVLCKISSSEDFSNYGIEYQPTCDNLQEDEETARYLMYCPWETDEKIFVWQNPPAQPIPMVCKQVTVQTTLHRMADCLRELCIVHPHGLYSGAECLTFVERGRLVYFLGAAKGTDEARRLYDPIERNEEYVKSLSKADLQAIGYQQLEERVSQDLTAVSKAVCSTQEQAQITQSRTSAIVQPHKSIQWEPEEAIVVLLDRSSSMNGAVYSDLPNLKRIDAAKELFSAFATRTQAYKLHHAFGLTVFQNGLEIKLPITKNVEDFEGSLRNVEAGGGTALTDAIINAVGQLSHYTCVKRILCLTDGENNCSTPYYTALQHVQAYNVIVDTVLLMRAGIRNEQKALSHSSGGVCVCPQSMQEALTFFEMDSVLSLKERLVTTYSRFSMDSCMYTPFETKDSFKSKYIHSFESLTTVSVKTYIDRDRTAYQPVVMPQKRRIFKELRNFMQSSLEHIKVFPCENEYCKWKVLMKGPIGTSYENGAFVLSIHFSDKYPTVPPDVRFLTPIYHCNVSASSGRICHSILSEAYTPATSIRDILSHIYGLLMCPDMDSPLDSTLADQYGYLRHQETDLDKRLDFDRFFHEADKYFKNARDHVRYYANKSFDVLKMEMAT